LDRLKLVVIADRNVLRRAKRILSAAAGTQYKERRRRKVRIA